MSVKEGNLGELLDKLSLHLKDYLIKQGVSIREDGFHSCISPTHPDHNPSSSLGGNSEFAGKVTHCFSCGQNYSIFHAANIFEKKPLSGVGFFQDTLPYLCKLYDIPYEPIQISEDQKREYERRRAYQDAVNICHAGIFTKGNLRTDHVAIKDLSKRGITLDAIRKFKIGCIDSHATYLKEMETLGWDNKEWLYSCDLASKQIFTKDGIIIPIYDDRNRPVGFVTRTTKELSKDQPKFVNSVNSDIYHKSEILFNFNNFEADKGALYIVEGYLDAIYLTQMGIPNVVALGSTTLTEEHINLLLKYNVRTIYLIFDGDEGGIKGTELAIERLAPYCSNTKGRMRVMIYELGDGKDPDDVVREIGSDEFIKKCRNNSVTPFAWTLKKATFQDDPLSIAQKAIPIIAAEESPITRSRMIKDLSTITNVSEEDIKKEVELKLDVSVSAFLEELAEVNKTIQIQLQKRKIGDTKAIIEDALLRIKRSEELHNKKIDNQTDFVEKISEIRQRIEEGTYVQGIMPAKFRKLCDRLDGIPYWTNLTLVGGRPQSGKSLMPGTPVLMYNGYIKKIEDVVVGDLLMGPDSKPRKVLALGSGEEEMYEIIPKTGMKWGCNEPHILSLRMSSTNGKVYKKDQIINLSIKEYLGKNNKFKHHAKQWRTGWELPNKEVPYDPYFIGMWLGDGDYGTIIITSADGKYVEEYFHNFANKNNLEISKTHQENNTYRYLFKNKLNHRNPLLQYINNNAKLNNEKRIPKEYLYNSREKRLELLAGLIDTDGHLNKYYYEITTKHKGLCEDIIYLGNSLGFSVTHTIKKVKIKEGDIRDYHRILIGGNIDCIPVKIERKKCKIISHRNNHLNTGFDIKPVGKGKYYGVVLDGDHLFLLSDGTVTHNTSWLTALAIDMIDSDEESAVCYMSIDDTTELMTLKILAMKSGLPTSKIKKYNSLDSNEKKAIDAAWSWINSVSNRFIIVDANKGNTVDALESHVDWFTRNCKQKKKVFLLDNFHKLRAGVVRGGKKTEAVSDTSEKIKEITQLNDLHIIATVELRKLDGTDARPTLSDLKDSVQLEYDADVIILVHNDKQAKKDESNINWVDTNTGTINPYLEIMLEKNKLTGLCDKLAYKLNSVNLRIVEDSWGNIAKLMERKKRVIKIGDERMF